MNAPLPPAFLAHLRAEGVTHYRQEYNYLTTFSPHERGHLSRRWYWREGEWVELHQAWPGVLTDQDLAHYGASALPPAA